MPSPKSIVALIFSPVRLLALSGALLQAAIPTASNHKDIASGTWGGEHVILEISKSGAEVEFDCAHGQITQAITVDKHGNFDVAGTLTREHGGPVLRDETPVASSARYSGHVDGDTLSLTVTLTKEKQEVGTYTLTRGAQPMLTKCR